MNKKGISVILGYAILFTIVITAAALAFRWGQEEVNELQDTHNLNAAEHLFLTIDSLTKEVSRGGEGSSRVLKTNFEKGEFAARTYHVSIASFDRDLTTLSMLLEVHTEVLDANRTREGNILKSYSNDIFEIRESYLEITVETQDDDVYTVVNLVDMKNIVLSGKKKLYMKNEGIEDHSYDTDPPYTLTVGNETYSMETENNFFVVKREGSTVYTKFLGEGTKTYHLTVRVATLSVELS